MSTPLNAINWFEIPVVDFERARKFYEALFDHDMPTREMGHLTMGFLPCRQGEGVGGTIVSGDGYVPSNDGTLVYLNGGDDLQTMLDRVEDAGGSIILHKTAIGEDIGYMAVFHDPDGNRLALHSMG